VWNNLRHEHGPFDIIGDVHGCCDELESLLRVLGYETVDGRGAIPQDARPSLWATW
jgi:protein phosphatase